MQAENSQEKASGRGKVLLAIVAVVLVVLGAAYLLSRSGPSGGGLASQRTMRIAVLPLDVEGKRDIAHVAYGITEGLITQLSRVDALHVTPFSSVVRYEGTGRPAVDIGRELGVSAVASGWVRFRGDYLSVDLSLEDVDDGRVLWHHRYTRLWDNLLLIEQKSAQYIVEALEIPLTAEQTAEVTRRSTDNGVAYSKYLDAMYLAKDPTPDNLREAIDELDLATRVDTTYAKAAAGLASALLTGIERGYAIDDACARGKAATELALKLDDTLPSAWVASARLRWLCDHDWTGAEHDFRQARQLDRNATGALLQYADFLAAADRVDEAIDLDRQAVHLEPDAVATHVSLASHLSQAEQREEADAHFQKAREIATDAAGVEAAWRIAKLARGDSPGDAAPIDDDPNGQMAQEALTLLQAGRTDAAFARMEQMSSMNNPALLRLFAQPLMAEHRQNARWQALAREVGWPPATAQP